MEIQPQQRSRTGYYTVLLKLEGGVMPYMVFADSDYHAARKVKNETGYIVSQHDIEGPYHIF